MADVGAADAPMADAPGDDAGAPVALPSTITDVALLAELDPPYTGYAGVDYIPTSTPPPTVSIVDLGEGLVVIDAEECADMCSALAGCNAASYYGDNPSNLWPGATQQCTMLNILHALHG
jgi:PAN domain